MNIFSKKIITFMLVIGILYVPFNFTKKINGQTQTTVTDPYFQYNTGNSYNPNSSSSQNLGSLNEYLSAAGPVISKLPLCTKGTADDMKNILPGFNEKVKEILNKEKDNLEGEISGEIDKAISDELGGFVNTFDKKTFTVAKETKKIVEDTKKNVSSLEKNDTCLKSIGRLVIKMLLQKITMATVEWINNGFDGGPAFVQDYKGFFKDLAKNEIMQFGIEINNPTLYPFGRSFMENQANKFKSNFNTNAQYSLDKLIKQDNPENSADAFYQDFSKGGWEAWTYLTQNPANNPLGFQIMASNELQKRIDEATKTQEDTLNQSGGFLGDYRCADPKGVTKEEHQAALKEMSANPDGPYENQKCNKWEYVTPGLMVAEASTRLVKYPDNNLLKAEDLNDALASILDALLNRFSTDLMDKGLAYFSDDISDNAGAGYLQIEEDNWGNFGNDVNDFSEFMIDASSWLKQNPYFNIRTDLNQALIDEQRIYMQKLEEQNKELNDLITVIRQLDYCIPGPHPGWESESWENLNTALNNIPSYQKSVGVNLISAIPILSVVGVGQVIENWVAKEKEIDYNARIIELFTQILPKDDTNATLLYSRTGTEYAIKTIFQEYAKLIKQIYTDNPDMPWVTKEAESEYFKIAGYQKLIEENKIKIGSAKTIISRLSSIKNEVDKLNNQLNSGSLNQNTYEESLKILIDTFGRLSADMYSGDNIANVDNILKQIKDKKNYIYRDLLKGPYGCEKELETTSQLPWQFFTIKRMVPPYKLLYNYNNLAAGANIDDPLGSGYINKMPNVKDANLYGPAFLSYTAYEPISKAHSNYLSLSQFKNKTIDPGILLIKPDPNEPSLFVNSYGGVTSVGRGDASSCLKNTNNYKCAGNFEYIINVY